MTGLRERKKQQTYDALSQAAIELFLEHGFDQVAVADIAAAADVSKPTLFKYFPTKEDLVMHRIADHRQEAARIVAAASGPPVRALREHFLAGLADREPTTGLNDRPQVLAYYRLVFTTPALATRLRQFMDADERALAGVLGDVLGVDLEAELLAAEVLSAQRILAYRNWLTISGGQSATARYAAAVAEAETAFARLG
ncbi:TetR/AcrR family transcriptional regulator [Kribbella solani]|uniref:AcrR family transcriptional regulator n=1 Tax=Kribbella solani TaxID=236067 RepID=A0A841DMJ7_9ACTN|nr:TetR family transcriptional regulator [Kribbella solani]MBB5977647.1 AcrR family transcriptional regulator [Kribbella solani]MDX2970265.1 TetR family transcriptional regulator [Kribbella solani]